MVQIVCKNCGRYCEASSFVVDPFFGKLVCAQCSKERKQGKRGTSGGPVVVTPGQKKEEQKVEVQKQQKDKPAGWDQEDEFLERASKTADPTPVYHMIDNEHIMYKCTACGYKFKYSVTRKQPGVCPYCAAVIERFKVR